MPRAASRAPVSAKGSAKIVWENFMVSRKTRSDAKISAGRRISTHDRLTSPLSPSISTPFLLTLTRNRITGETFF
jgi:hypothetical protein